uniref:Uncharacterized protein n=1 Tax=Anguilla anguilla TaxID=7936 RepID=A0A0E9WN89_ANGAN
MEHFTHIIVINFPCSLLGPSLRCKTTLFTRISAKPMSSYTCTPKIILHNTQKFH